MSTQRRRPTIAKDWQLAVLKKLQSESENPTEEQRLAVVAETGLDKKWVRNWFTRQRSRNKKGQLSTVAAFRVRLCDPSRPSSTPTDPAPAIPRQTSPAVSPQPSINTKTSSPSSVTSSNRTIAIPTYSRDPLCHRYPDFSQFFRPQGHERTCTLEPSTPTNTSHNPLMQLLANPHTSMHFQGSFNPLQLGNLSMNPAFATCLQSCPVAFSMRLVDLLVRV